MNWTLGKKLTTVYGVLIAFILGFLGVMELKGLPFSRVKGLEQILTEQTNLQIIRLADLKSRQLNSELNEIAAQFHKFTQNKVVMAGRDADNHIQLLVQEFVGGHHFFNLRMVDKQTHTIIISSDTTEIGRIFMEANFESSLKVPEDIAYLERKQGTDSSSLFIAAFHVHENTGVEHIVIGEFNPYPTFQEILQAGRELGSSGAIDIVDSRGKVIASTDPSILWESNIPRIYPRAAAGFEGLDTASFDFGQVSICAYRHISLSPSLGWGLIVRRNVQELQAPIRNGNQLIVFTTIIAILLATFVSLIVSRSLTRPLRALTRLAKDISKGNYAPHQLIKETGEVGELAHAFTEMTDNLTKTMEDLKKAKQEAETANQNLQETMRELEHMVDTDRLTGAWNRRYFDSMIERELRRTERYGLPLSLMIFDIDHFKKVNDTFGHDLGDQVLVGVTERVRSQIRSSDALIRWGGEEFILVTSSTTLAGATALAEKIRICMAATEFPTVGTVTISIGVAQFRPGESKREWISRADKLLYAAKHNGRNRVVSSTGGGDAHEPFHLEWYDRFLCGHPLIDKQHKELFVYINCMMNSITNPKGGKFESYLPGLIESLSQHYHDEEEIMREINFVDIEMHAHEHHRLLTQIEEYQSQIKEGSLHPVDMMEFLIRQTAVGHIIGYDMQFFPLMRRKNTKSITDQ